MKTLDFNEMENVNGGNGTEDWCAGIDMMMAAGDGWQSIDSASYVVWLYDNNCR